MYGVVAGVAVGFIRRHLESTHNRVGVWVILGRFLAWAGCSVALEEHKAWMVASWALLWWPGVWIPLLVVPWRAPRVTYYVTRALFPMQFWCEPQAGAAFFAALAWRRQAIPSEEGAQFISRMLASAKPPAGGAALSTLALMALHRGDTQSAGQLFHLVAGLSFRHGSRRSRSLALEWLTLQALERGSLPPRPRFWQIPPIVYFIRDVERRLSEGAASVPDWRLRLGFVAAGRYRQTHSLLRLALQAESPLLCPNLTERAKTWDERLERLEQNPELAHRIEELGAHTTVDAVIQELRAGVVEELATAYARRPLPEDAAHPPVLREVAMQFRERLYREVERRLELIDATPADSTLEPFLLGTVWGALRADLETLLHQLNEEPRVVYELCGHALLNWAADLHNTAKQGMVAHDVFAFLLPLCRAASDLDTLKLIQGNLKLTR